MKTLPRRIDGLLLDVASAAALLGMTDRALRARVARRVVPFRKLGGRVLFRRDELIEFFRRLDGCNLDQALANIQARKGGQ